MKITDARHHLPDEDKEQYEREHYPEEEPTDEPIDIPEEDTNNGVE